MNTTSNKHLAKEVDFLVGALSAQDLHYLREFIEEKTSSATKTLDLPYRPDEWDSNGVIAKVQDLAKNFIKQNYELHNQLEPRSFTVSRATDASDLSREYGSYDADGVILYSVVVAVSGLDGCSGGHLTYTSNGKGMSPDSGTIAIHRCETVNDWKVSGIASGTRLELSILFQEISKQISYDYPIDQISEDLLDF